MSEYPAQRYIGATLIVSTSGTEGILDCTGLGDGTYPKAVVLHARGADMYLAQGPSNVALHATAAQNFILSAGCYLELQIQGSANAYFAHEQVTGAGVLAVTRADKPAS